MSLRRHGCDESPAEDDRLVQATEGFSGAEVAELVPSAMFRAFADGGRAISIADLAEVAGELRPMSKTAADRVGKIRDWARERARRASTPERRVVTAAATAGMARRVDV